MLKLVWTLKLKVRWVDKEGWGVEGTREVGTIGRRRGRRIWRLSESRVRGWEEGGVGTGEEVEEVGGEVEGMEDRVRMVVVRG